MGKPLKTKSGSVEDDDPKLLALIDAQVDEITDDWRTTG